MFLVKSMNKNYYMEDILLFWAKRLKFKRREVWKEEKGQIKPTDDLPTPQPRLLPANSPASEKVSRTTAAILAAQSAAIPAVSALKKKVRISIWPLFYKQSLSYLNTQDDFWSGHRTSKHLAASSPETHCLKSCCVGAIFNRFTKLEKSFLLVFKNRLNDLSG